MNLYPFYDKVISTGVGFEDGIENIDIGGPAMIRAAAKVVCLTENANKFKFWNDDKSPFFLFLCLYLVIKTSHVL